MVKKTPIRLGKNVRKPQGGFFGLTLYISEINVQIYTKIAVNIPEEWRIPTM